MNFAELFDELLYFLYFSENHDRFSLGQQRIRGAHTAGGTLSKITTTRNRIDLDLESLKASTNRFIQIKSTYLLTSY